MIKGHLYDLDELILKCHGPSAKDYIDEAVAAYKAGAYRSCIITTWIAVYFDLVDKLRVHARSGVPTATEWIANFEENVKSFNPGDPRSSRKLLNMESEILTKASDPEIGILTTIECEDLKRLREDRHRCAHPTYLNEVDKFSPTAERARNHIRIAIDAVLTKNPVPGSLMASRVLSHCRSAYFPAETSEAESEIRTELGSDLSSTILGPALDGLFEDLFDPENSAKNRRQRIAAIDALRSIHRQSAASALNKQIRALASIDAPEIWTIAIHLLNRLDWAWTDLEEPQQSLIKRVVRQVDENNGFGANIIVQATLTAPLEAIGRERARDLSVTALTVYLDRMPEKIFREEILERTKESSSWRASETLFGLLHSKADLLDDDGYLTSFLELSSRNDQIFTAPGFGEVVKQIIAKRAFSLDDEGLRSAINCVMTKMTADHRVDREALRSLILSADFLGNITTPEEQRS